jgi:hypothetical protein
MVQQSKLVSKRRLFRIIGKLSIKFDIASNDAPHVFMFSERAYSNNY